MKNKEAESRADENKSCSAGRKSMASINEFKLSASKS